MRAPRWFRNFSEWRWAPFVAPVAGTLAFIALALLLIPIQFDAASRTGRGRASEALGAPPRRTLSAALPALAARVALPSPPRPIATDEGNAAPAVPPLAAVSPVRTAVPEPEEEPPSAFPARDFSANIADRGDRPLAPTPRSQTQQ